MEGDSPAAMSDAPGVSPAAQKRPTPRQGDNAQPPSRHTPSALAIAERDRANLWKNVAISVCLAALGLSYLTIRAGRATERVYIMDPLGIMYAGPVEPLSASSRFFNVTAIYAANAALQRSPAGFDLGELLKLYFSPRAIAKLEDDCKQRAGDMRRRSLQWKPMIDSISDPVRAGQHCLVEVHGRIISAGAFANRSFYDEPPFTLVLTFMRNPDIGKSGAYPWVCDDFDLRIEKTERRTP